MELKNFNGLIRLFINGNPVFSDGPRGLPTNSPACVILYNWVFDNLITVDDLLVKALRRVTTCLLVNDIYEGNFSHYYQSY